MARKLQRYSCGVATRQLRMMRAKQAGEEYQMTDKESTPLSCYQNWLPGADHQDHHTPLDLVAVASFRAVCSKMDMWN